MIGEIKYLGHASLKIKSKNGKVIYVDPFAGDDYSEPADLILITHQHFDHSDINKVAKKDNTQIWSNHEAIDHNNYNTLDFDGILIKAVEAYNLNHPKRKGVGYLINDNGTKIYIAGDTAKTKQMEELANEEIDFAFLPIDGTFTMSPRKATECAEIIKSKHSIPYHTNPRKNFDEKQAQKFDPSNKLVMRPNEKIKY